MVWRTQMSPGLGSLHCSPLSGTHSSTSYTGQGVGVLQESEHQFLCRLSNSIILERLLRKFADLNHLRAYKCTVAPVAPLVCRQVEVCSNLFHTCNVHYPPACQYDMMRPVWLACDGWDEDGSQSQSQAGSQGSQARQARLGPGSSRQADSRSSSRPAILSGLQSALPHSHTNTAAFYFQFTSYKTHSFRKTRPTLHKHNMASL